MRILNRFLRCIEPAWGLGVFLLLSAWTPAYSEEPAEQKGTVPVHISREASGVVVLTLELETQKRIALTVTAVEATSFHPTVIAHGKLEQDPTQSFTLRAPVAGVLKTLSDQQWPGIGSVLESNLVLGYVEPRFTASEMVDLHARRLDAQAEFDEINADLEAVRASFENKSRLNTEHGLVSDRSMEEARARYKSSEARLVAAKQKVDLYESLVRGQSRESALFPVQASASGQIVEVLAQPGELVDTGQVLLRTVRFDAFIANVSLFVGEFVEPPLSQAQIVVPAFVGAFVEPPLSQAQIVVPGGNDPVLTGELIGTGSAASPVTGGQALLFHVDVPAGSHLRPGVAVTAYISTPGAPLGGVLIPRSAVLRHGGRTWAYVQTSEQRFERRDIMLHCPTSDGWFATSGVSPGEKVVVAGAQMLLSEELKAQIENEAEAEE